MMEDYSTLELFLEKRRTCNSQLMLGSEKFDLVIKADDGNGRYSDGIIK